jgi:trimethylamine-N-oxide reductase (cytochrome c)
MPPLAEHSFSLDRIMKRQVLKTILFALPKVLDLTARRFPAYRDRLKERDLVAWIGLMDESIGRVITFRNGRVRSRAGRHRRPDVRMAFKDVATALRFLSPKPDQGEIIHAAKNFKVVTEGEDELLVWLLQTLSMMQTVSLPMGTPMRDGTRRYTTCTNGGPLFVYVKDGRVVRVTPIDLDGTDAPSWVIEARGRRFSPPRRGLVAPHALTLKSLVYSDKRILHPMRRLCRIRGDAATPVGQGTRH